MWRNKGVTKRYCTRKVSPIQYEDDTDSGSEADPVKGIEVEEQRAKGDVLGIRKMAKQGRELERENVGDGSKVTAGFAMMDELLNNGLNPSTIAEYKVFI